MTPNEPTPPTLYRYFAGITEQTFQVGLGVADSDMIDYVTTLLLSFLRTESVNKIRQRNGQLTQGVGEMLVEADNRIGSARRDIHRQIGDYTLFWAGLYPESLRSRRNSALDQFEDYCQHGRRAYLIASTIETDRDEDASCDVLEKLGHQFEMCAYGLREVRREWERRDDGDGFQAILIN